MEPRPSRGVRLPARILALAALALLGAWVVGHYGGDGRSAELLLALPPPSPALHAARAVGSTPAAGRAAAGRVATARRARPLVQRSSSRPRVASTSSPAAAQPRPVSRRSPGAAAPATTTPEPPPASSDRGLARLEPPPPDAPLEPLSTSEITATAGSTSAHVTWQTNFPSMSQGADGTGAAPSIWPPPDVTARFTHELDFTNLTPATSYHLWLHDVDEWNRPLTTPVTVTTAPRSGPTTAAIAQGAILVDGEPFFPLTTWNTCTNFVPGRIALGFNLFMGEGCGRETRLAASLDGKALAVVDAKTRIADQPGVIGWYYPDELDGRLSGPLSASAVTSLAVAPPDGMISFLTLTNHFFSGAAPLAIGRSLYPQLASLANVVGFDLYPLQNWCRNDAFQSVYDAQRELETLAAGKPTFQWIEVRKMDCSAALSPTPATVAAETWLAIAGGADGIGYFPDAWTPAVGDEIGALNAEITDLAPALLAPEVASSAPAPIKVGARALNGALYVIAVNSSTAPADAQLQVEGGGSRTFDVRGEGRRVTATDNTISDHFDGLAVHVYVTGPEGWTQSVQP